jgi:hypothetical protein
MKFYMFRTAHLSIIRSLFIVHTAMVYVIQVCRQLSSRTRMFHPGPVWHTPLLSVQWINSWWWTDELSETCRISWQNKFVKLVHLAGFITKKFVTMHGHMDGKVLLEVYLHHWIKCDFHLAEFYEILNCKPTLHGRILHTLPHKSMNKFYVFS